MEISLSLMYKPKHAARNRTMLCASPLELVSARVKKHTTLDSDMDNHALALEHALRMTSSPPTHTPRGFSHAERNSTTQLNISYVLRSSMRSDVSVTKSTELSSCASSNHDAARASAADNVSSREPVC
jgi:hypothetical protein